MELAGGLIAVSLLALWLGMVWLDARATRRLERATEIPTYWLLKRDTAERVVGYADLSGDLVTLTAGILKGTVRVWEKDHEGDDRRSP